MTLRRTIALLLLLFLFFIAAACSDGPGTFGTWFGASDKPLLAPVVQVALDATASLVGGRDNPRARGLELRPAGANLIRFSNSCPAGDPRFARLAAIVNQPISG